MWWCGGVLAFVHQSHKGLVTWWCCVLWAKVLSLYSFLLPVTIVFSRFNARSQYQPIIDPNYRVPWLRCIYHMQ